MVRNVGGKFTTSEDGMQVVKVDNLDEVSVTVEAGSLTVTPPLAVTNDLDDGLLPEPFFVRSNATGDKQLFVAAAQDADGGQGDPFPVTNVTDETLRVSVSGNGTVANLSGVPQIAGLTGGTFSAVQSGFSAVVNNTTAVDLWSGSDADLPDIVYPYVENISNAAAAGVAVQISSATAGDTSPGVPGDGDGPKIYIAGLKENAGGDAEYAYEVVELRGQTAVSAVNEYMRIFTIQAGGNQAPTGPVYLSRASVVPTEGVPADADLFAKMTSPEYRDMRAAFTVPPAMDGVILGYSVASKKDIQAYLMVRWGDGFWVCMDTTIIPGTAGGVVDRKFAVPLAIPAESDVVLRAKSLTEATGVSVYGAIEITCFLQE